MQAVPQNINVDKFRVENVPAGKVDAVSRLIMAVTEEESPKIEAQPMTQDEAGLWAVNVEYAKYAVGDSAAWCQVLRDMVGAEVYDAVDEDGLARITLVVTACTQGSDTSNVTLTLGADAQLKVEAIPAAAA